MAATRPGDTAEVAWTCAATTCAATARGDAALASCEWREASASWRTADATDPCLIGKAGDRTIAPCSTTSPSASPASLRHGRAGAGAGGGDVARPTLVPAASAAGAGSRDRGHRWSDHRGWSAGLRRTADALHRARGRHGHAGKRHDSSRIAPTETKFARADLSLVEADGTFAGYASLFGKADLGRDMVHARRVPRLARAARRRRASSCSSSTTRPSRSASGWRSARTARGLFVKRPARCRRSRGRARCCALMRERRARRPVDRLPDGARADRPRRPASASLIEIDLWEISVVTFPMLPEARVSSREGAAHPAPAAMRGTRNGARCLGRIRRSPASGRSAAVRARSTTGSETRRKSLDNQ